MLATTLLVLLGTGCGDDEGDGVDTTATTVADPTTAPPATPSPPIDAPSEPTEPTDPTGVGCDPATLRAALDASGAVEAALEFEITHLECADGFGWAVITSPTTDAADVLFTASGARSCC